MAAEVVLEGLHPLKHALRFGARVRRAVAPDPARVVALARELAPDVADEIAALVEHGDVRAPLDVVAWASRPPERPLGDVIIRSGGIHSINHTAVVEQALGLPEGGRA